MKAYHDLTERGKIRRLRQLAFKALDQYPLEIANLRLLGVFTNTLFKVQTTTGAAYVLRVCKPGWRTDTDIAAEVAWLQALAQDTDIHAPQPQATQQGKYIIHVTLEGVPEARRCVLLRWLPGISLGKKLTPENLTKLGTLFAQLHQHGAQFSPPASFTTRRMDNIYARDEADILFGESCQDAFTPESREIIARTQQKVSQAFAKLYADPTGLRVIHNDLWHGNLNIHKGQLYPLDFEDTIWGYPVQDIAMSLQDLMTDVEADQFESLQAAFRQGYEKEADWPEQYSGQIDLFRAGRMLWVANYVACYEREHLSGFLEWLATQFARFLETGVIRKS